MKIAPPRLTAAHLCGAPRRGGKGLCCRPASAGKTRCRLHGADSTGPATAEGKERAVSAMVAGRAAWVARMNALKAAGVIDRLPGGRRKPGGSQSDPCDDRVVRAARLALEEAAMSRSVASATQANPPATLPVEAGDLLPVQALATVAKAWVVQGHAEKLDTLTIAAFETLKDILDQPTALADPKMLSLQKDAALSVIGAKIKVDKASVRPANEAENLNRLLEALQDGSRPVFVDSE